MRLQHLGASTDRAKAKEAGIERFVRHRTGPRRNLCGMPWMRSAPDAPLFEQVKTVAHGAFEDDALAVVIRGHELLMTPDGPSEGVRVAVGWCDGARAEPLPFDGGQAAGSS